MNQDTIVDKTAPIEPARDEPAPATDKKPFVWVSLLGGLAILAIGFALGFFPGVLGDNGSLARGLDQGWRFAVFFSVTMAVVGLVYQVLKRSTLHPLGISMVMMMIAMGSMFTFGRMISRDGAASWNDLGSGLLNGALIGATVYWLQSRKQNRGKRGHA